MILLGSAVNGMAIAAGSVLGVLIGNFLPTRIRTALMSVLALITIGIAAPGLMDSQKPLVPILSLALGTLIGELLDVDGGLHRLGERVQKRLSGHSSVAEGFVNGTVVFAVGTMAVMGALESGLQGQHTILYAKAVIDGVAALIFASTMGIGVALSGVATFAVEGLMAVLASLVAPYLGEAVLSELSFIGSLLIVGISLNMLGVTKLRILNMTPSLLLAVILCLFL